MESIENGVKNLYKIIKDYREDEGFGVSERSITQWVNQFDEKDRVFILSELSHVFEKIYFSKIRVKTFLKGIIDKLKEERGYSTHKELLDNSRFLDLQAEGKSQKILLELLFEVLGEQFNYDPKYLGSKSHKHNIYIDDVLCTGNTFFNNLKDWANGREKENLLKLRSKEIDLTVFYMFIAEKYYHKKRSQFRHQISEDFRDLVTVLSICWFNNEILKPVNENLPEIVNVYKDKVESQADSHAKSKGFSSYEPDFFRSEINSEKFYSSVENRKRLERILLIKGIEILNKANVAMANIRPLGYSLPAYKDFGFGGLVFTWRNVANNTPLVFWYRGGGFDPLFINRR